MRRIMMLLAISMLLSPTTAQAALALVAGVLSLAWFNRVL
jgi:hypothetical protein